MRVGVYFSPWSRSLSPTGVGRHAIEMTSALAAHADVEASRFTTRSDHERVAHQLPESISQMPVRYLPGSETMSRWMMMGLPIWKIDDQARDIDWVYCTKEQPVSTRRCKLAVNVHDALPFEVSVAGLPQHSSFRSRLKWNRIINRIRRADLITTVSEFTRRRLIELFSIEEDRIVVTGNGVTVEYFRGAQPGDEAVLRRFGVEPQKYFIAVGSLTSRKGGDLLLDAAIELKQRGIDVPILVTGRRHDSALEERYRRHAEEVSGLPLRLVGFVSDDDQRALLSGAIALVFPTRYEGFGIPALEAMAAETVVICSSTSAMPEVVGDVAVRVEPLGVEALTQCMTDVMQMQYKRAELITRGKKHAGQFRWQCCADRLVRAMKERS